MQTLTNMIGSIILLIGLILFILTLQIGLNLFYTPYIFFIIGICLIGYSAIKTKAEKSVLCRIGLHKYEKIGLDDEIKSRSIYQCKRCGVKKKVFKAV